jgi:hypothetical protein
MSKPPKVDLKGIISGEVIEPETEAKPLQAPRIVENVVAMSREPRRAPPRAPSGHTLKERAHQLSVYLEAPVYNCLRDIAHAERTKLHSLMLEAVDLLLKKRGEPSIRELNKQAE